MTITPDDMPAAVRGWLMYQASRGDPDAAAALAPPPDLDENGQPIPPTVTLLDRGAAMYHTAARTAGYDGGA